MNGSRTGGALAAGIFIFLVSCSFNAWAQSLLSPGTGRADEPASQQNDDPEKSPPPADFMENLQRFETIKVKAGKAGYRIEFSVFRWGGSSAQEDGGQNPQIQGAAFKAAVVTHPPFVTNIQWPSGDRAVFSGDEYEKELVLEFDTVKETRGDPEGELVISITPASKEIEPNERIYRLPLQTEILEKNTVIVYPLRNDAPEEIPHEEIIDYCDTTQTRVFKYDRIGLFFTPARDLKPPLADKHFSFLVKTPENKTAFTDLDPGVHDIIFQEQDDGSFEPKPPYAKQGSPGMFSVCIYLRSEHNPPGEYSLTTTDGEVQQGMLLGVGDPLLNSPEGAEPQTEGTFTVHDARLHFQGFVIEPARDRSLKEDQALFEGVFNVKEQTNGTTVTFTVDANWHLPEERNGGRAAGIELFRIQGGFTVELPREMDPGAFQMGEIKCTAQPTTGAGALDPDSNRGNNVRRTFDYEIRSLKATNKLPPDRYLFEGKEIPKSWGGIRKTGSKSGLFERGGFKYIITSDAQNGGAVSLELLSSKENPKFGVPERGLAWHLRDDSTIYVIPIGINFTSFKRGSLFDSAIESIWGYAVYGAKPGTYTGPHPEGPEKTGDDEESEDADDETGDETDPDAGTDDTGGSGQTGGGTGAGGQNTSAGPDQDDSSNQWNIDPALVKGPERDGLIRQWISAAEPPLNALKGYNLHYNKWGVMIGRTNSGIISATPGRPDNSAGMRSEDYLWGYRTQLDSVNHCTLEEFVMANLRGEPTDHCIGRYKRLRDDAPGVDDDDDSPFDDDAGNELESSADADTAEEAPSNATEDLYGNRSQDLDDRCFQQLQDALRRGDREAARQAYHCITGEDPSGSDAFSVLSGETERQRNMNQLQNGLDEPHDGGAVPPDETFLASHGIDPLDLLSSTGIVDPPSSDDLRSPPGTSGGDSRNFNVQRQSALQAINNVMRNQQQNVRREHAAAEHMIRTHPIPTRGGMSGIQVQGTDQVTITVWDHGTQDGDRVRIDVGGRTVAGNLMLTKRKQHFRVRLTSRFTPIRVLAHNQGSQGPNTASLRVSAAGGVDETTSWNLKTNDMGSTLIRRDD